mmetsp:Transcript_17074/g.28514  ORF Transcript_17074/g.28514 Transcript_17074/m.28514 type:complete len:214 (+) Transcript_17074:128-769(+)
MVELESGNNTGQDRTSNVESTSDHNHAPPCGKPERSSSTDFPLDAATSSSAPKIDWRDLPIQVLRNIVCSPDGKLLKLIPPEECNACPYCADTCQLDTCRSCAVKREKRMDNKIYSICEVRRHRNLASCWVVVDTNIYDATTYLERHPGGVTSILRHSGGIDCTEHLFFHSVRGKKKWKALGIGKVVYCRGAKDDPDCPPRPIFSQNNKCIVS